MLTVFAKHRAVPLSIEKKGFLDIYNHYLCYHCSSHQILEINLTLLGFGLGTCNFFIENVTVNPIVQ